MRRVEWFAEIIGECLSSSIDIEVQDLCLIVSRSTVFISLFVGHERDLSFFRRLGSRECTEDFIVIARVYIHQGMREMMMAQIFRYEQHLCFIERRLVQETIDTFG